MLLGIPLERNRCFQFRCAYKSYIGDSRRRRLNFFTIELGFHYYRLLSLHRGIVFAFISYLRL